MSFAPRIVAAISGKDAQHGPLPAMLLVLTTVTGLVDAVSYLRLGHVFVANMTGNIAFLGFAVADAKEFSIAASLAATAAFLIGALAGGRLGSSVGRHRGRFLATAIFLEIAAIGAALLVVTLAGNPEGDTVRYQLIVLLAIGMGIQNATARRLGIPDLTTTVLTLTLTGLAADSTLAGGKNPRPGRRLLATTTMFLGAAVGAFVIFHYGVSTVLALAFVLLAASGIAACLSLHSSDAWTVGT